jgi:predicted metallopeptidase
MGDLMDAILSGGTKQKTEYVEAPEVQELSEKLIEDFGFIDAGMARIKYLFKISEKSKFAGKISKAGLKWKHITGYDYVLEVWKSFWEAEPHNRDAMIYHELSHIEREDTKKGIRWKVKDHPIEAFPDEIKMFGPWSSHLKSAVEALDDFNSEVAKPVQGDATEATV